MTHSVSSHLSVRAAEYDEAIRRFVPSYEEMLAELVDALPLANGSKLRVLDLGAGTGALAARVLDKVPGARVTLLDADAEMLRVAEDRLASRGDRSSFVRGSFHDPLPSSDAVVASLALHHVFEPERKAALYRGIFDALPAGGRVVIGDAMVGDGALGDEARARWARHLVDHGDTEAAAYARFAEWAHEDRYFPIAVEIAALGRAGFDVDVRWRRGPMAVLVGVRPARAGG